MPFTLFYIQAIYLTGILRLTSKLYWFQSLLWPNVPQEQRNLLSLMMAVSFAVLLVWESMF